MKGTLNHSCDVYAYRETLMRQSILAFMATGLLVLSGCTGKSNPGARTEGKTDANLLEGCWTAVGASNSPAARRTTGDLRKGMAECMG